MEAALDDRAVHDRVVVEHGRPIIGVDAVLDHRPEGAPGETSRLGKPVLWQPTGAGLFSALNLRT